MSRSVRRITHLAVTTACLAASTVWPVLGYGQSLAGGYSSARAEESVVRVDLSSQNRGSRQLNIPKGKSAIIELPVDARDVLVTNPAVADAVLRSPRRIYVLGTGLGTTDAVFFDTAGRRILSLDITISQDTGPVADTIARLLPGSNIKVDAVNDSLVLSGQVMNSLDAEKAQRLAERFVQKPENVVNMISVAGKEQVMIKVRVVEVQRNIVKQLGLNLQELNTLSNPQTAFQNAATYGVNGSYLGQGLATLVGKSGNTQYGSQIEAFERAGLLRTLAEPNLTAVSGESAKFLAGGEYPVPTGEDNTGKVSIEFKPYGVGLGFTPVVLSSGLISLKVSTEVSELTSQGSFALATGSSSSNSSSGTTGTGTTTGSSTGASTGSSETLTIPALKVRRAETTVELPSGGGMMIAGLLQEETQQEIDSLPGLKDLPILGALFRSRDYVSGETELVIIVTPYLVKDVPPDQLQTPADGLQTATDFETDVLGKLNKAYKTPPAAVSGRTYQGPYGYVIE